MEKNSILLNKLKESSEKLKELSEKLKDFFLKNSRFRQLELVTIAEKRQKKPALRQLHGILLASCVVLILFIAAMALGRRVYCKENGRKDRRTTVTSYFCHQMHNFIILLFLLQPLRLQTRRLPPKTSIPYQPQRFS